MDPLRKVAIPAATREAVRELRRRIASGHEVQRQDLQALHREYPAWFEPFQLLLTHCLGEGDDAAVEVLLAHAERAWAGMPACCLARAQVHYDRGESEQALAAAYDGLRQPVRDLSVARSLLRLVKTIGSRRAVREAPLPEDVGKHLRQPALIQLAWILSQCGDTQRADALLAAAGVEDPAAAPTPEPVGAEGIDWDADIVCVPSPGSDTALVVFTGLAHETSVPMEVLYAELAPFCSHFIGLRDLSRLAFLAALPALGADPAGSAAALRERLADMGATKVVMVGNSAGCVGAMLYGALVKADAVVCYGPISSMVAPFEHRGRAVTRRVRELVEPKWLASPMEFLAACDPPIPVQVNFGELMALDRQHAAEIASLPHARLQPIEGYDRHDVVRELIARGELRARLATFLAPIVGEQALAGAQLVPVA